MAGNISKTCIRPKPTRKIMTINPVLMPNIWGMVFFIPKFVPDAMSIRLFGPGVIEPTKAKAIKAVIMSKFIMGQIYSNLM